MDYETITKTIPALIGITIAQVDPNFAGGFFEKYGVPIAMLVVTIYAIVYQEVSRNRREKMLEEQRLKRDTLEREERDLEREQRRLEREMSERQLNKKTEELQEQTKWLRGRYDVLMTKLTESQNFDQL
jgi:flagellar biosynthesis/type III secretory pathway M-ring protein FliF/YscJ